MEGTYVGSMESKLEKIALNVTMHSLPSIRSYSGYNGDNWQPLDHVVRNRKYYQRRKKGSSVTLKLITQNYSNIYVPWHSPDIVTEVLNN